MKQVPLIWLDAMDRWSKKARNLPQYTLGSSVIIQGSQDSTIDWRYSMLVYNTLFPFGAYHYIEGAEHKLINETEPYWQQVTELLDRYLTYSMLSQFSYIPFGFRVLGRR